MFPEHSSRIEQLESLYIWIRLLLPHPHDKKKHYIMSMHSLGVMDDFIVDALFKTFDISGE